MFHHRLLWGCVCILACVSNVSAFAAKVKEKAPPPDENSRLAELVKIGLQAELAGNSESRELHLQAALDIEPDYAPAHWQLGKVRVGEEWLPVAKASAAISKTPRYSLYRAQRDELDGSVKKELALARWCEQEGMKDRAEYHYARVFYNPKVAGDTANEMVKKLGLIAYGGQLRTRAEIDEMEREAAAIDAAWKDYAKKFERWRDIIESQKDARIKSVRDQMHAIQDLHVASLAEAHLVTAGEAWSHELVHLLGRFTALPATVSLTRTAVLSPHDSVRDAANKELKKRKLHDFVPLLMVGLSPTTKSQFLVKMGPDFTVDYQYTAVTESATQKVVVSSKAEHQEIPVPVFVPRKSGGMVAASQLRRLERLRSQAELQVVRVMDRAAESEFLVQQQNQLAQAKNANFYESLEKTTGQAIPNDPSQWYQWWRDHNEVVYETPTQYYVSQYTVPVYRPFIQMVSCFTAGTPVYTESGPQPIDSIRPGDRVLSQDPNSGELAFKLVQNVTVRPPSKLRKITLGGSEIVTTLGHPFWVNGTGWKMAKELEPEQNLHTLTGAAAIVKVEELPNPDRAYNLVVADYNTYFVGSANVLVHDNIYRQPTLAKVPGLIEAGR